MPLWWGFLASQHRVRPFSVVAKVCGAQGRFTKMHQYQCTKHSPETGMAESEESSFACDRETSIVFVVTSIKIHLAKVFISGDFAIFCLRIIPKRRFSSFYSFQTVTVDFLQLRHYLQVQQAIASPIDISCSVGTSLLRSLQPQLGRPATHSHSFTFPSWYREL